MTRQSPAEIQVLKFAMKDSARRLFPHELVAKCLLWRIPGKHAEEWTDGLKAQFKNLQTCNSVWMCPVCSGKITERAAQLLKKAIENHPEYDVAMAVLTLRHKRREVLIEVLRGLQESFRRFTAGRWYIDFRTRYGIVATIRSLEVTFGDDNGWHPHYHILLFFNHKLPPDEEEHKLPPRLVQLRNEVAARWQAVLDMEGHDADTDHGVAVTHRATEIANYLSKYGSAKRWNLEHEVTKAPSKTGKTSVNKVIHKSPFMLLKEYTLDDNSRSGALFLEYGRVFRGRHQLQWSRGALKLLGIKELREVEKAARQIGDESSWLLYQFTDAEWNVIRKANALKELIRLGNKGDQKSREAVIAYVNQLMIESAHPKRKVQEVNVTTPKQIEALRRCLKR